MFFYVINKKIGWIENNTINVDENNQEENNGKKLSKKEIEEKEKTEFETKGSIKFKLYSLEYLLEKKDDCVQIYAIDYPTRKSKYNSIEELMNNFTVYNEPLITLLNNIKILN